MIIPTFKPSIKRKDMDSVLTCMVSDVIGPATLTERLIKVLGDYLQAAGGYAVRDYPRAIEVAFAAAGLSAGDTVVLSPLLPWIYHHVCRGMGLNPVYVDVDAHSPVIDAALVRIVDNPRAVVAASTLGFAPDLESLQELPVTLIEDVSQGLGANTGTHSVGTVGHFTICGMEPEHIITSGGGAAVFARGRKERAALKTVCDTLPRELFLPDMNAALGLIQALEVERLVQRRKEIAAVYARSAAQGRHKTAVQLGDGENVFFSFAVLVESAAGEVVAYARKKSIEVVTAFESSVIGYASVPREEGAEVDPLLPEATVCPNARRFLLRTLLFPLYPMLKRDEVELVQRVLATLP